MTPRTAGEIRAHARAASPDPAPGHAAPAAGTVWLYGPAQFELGLLERIVVEGRAAGRFVDYSDDHGRPDRRTAFRLRDAGAVELLPGGEWSADAPAAALPTGWSALDAGGRDLVVTVRAEGAAALAVGDATGWEVLDGDRWVPAHARPGGATPPHLDDEPVVRLPLVASEGLLDAGRTLLGRPVLTCSGTPRVVSGESREEALSDAVPETRHDVVDLGGGRWTTRHRLGFRFLAVHDAEVTDAAVDASIRPSRPPGAFASSDEGLTRIAAVASWTLRTCLQGLVLDGAKRDRMPWIGDQALATAVNAYTVADPGIVRDGLVALGRQRRGYVNGLADYSLWWVIGQGFLQRFFGERKHLEREAEGVHAFLERLAEEAGPDAVLRPRRPGGFSEETGPVLIDWGVEPEPGRDSTALQALWFWALSTGADLLARVGHSGESRWRDLAATLRSTLEERVRAVGAWSRYLDEPQEHRGALPVDDPHTCFLGALAGLIEPTEPVVAAIRAARPRTPWMAAFALRALGAAGRRGEAVALLRSRWIPMLDAGATTFWEEFPDDGEPLAMYGRPFGRSLAHAWGAGPAALLPELVLGIAPLADGWTRIAVDPELGDLDWVAAVVPTPFGELVVSADRESVMVDVPDGAVLVADGRETPGPANVEWTLRA